jgi:hypothetical protein
MNRPNHENRKFFLGTEVEHTPMLGRRTLFVIGCQSTQDIESVLNDPYTSIGGRPEHIYFGANHSFDPQSNKDWARWCDLIRTYLAAGFWCTLDFDVRHAETIAETALVEYNTFIPMISVKIPYVRLMTYNAVVKIDDRDFAATNPGVWCHRLHNLQSPETFTDWSEYSSDEVLR